MFMLDPHGPTEIRLPTFSLAINNKIKISEDCKKRKYLCIQSSAISENALLLEGTQALPVCFSGKRNIVNGSGALAVKLTS
jgi:hypothetical protein